METKYYTVARIDGDYAWLRRTDKPEDDLLIVARALYGAMVSGAFSGVTAGASLEEVMVTYLASLTGVNIDTLREWMPADSVLRWIPISLPPPGWPCGPTAMT